MMTGLLHFNFCCFTFSLLTGDICQTPVNFSKCLFKFDDRFLVYYFIKYVNSVNVVVCYISELLCENNITCPTLELGLYGHNMCRSLTNKCRDSLSAVYQQLQRNFLPKILMTVQTERDTPTKRERMCRNQQRLSPFDTEPRLAKSHSTGRRETKLTLLADIL